MKREKKRKKKTKRENKIYYFLLPSSYSMVEYIQPYYSKLLKNFDNPYLDEAQFKGVGR